MKPPARIVYDGTDKACAPRLGEAKKQLRELLEFMSFQKLPSHSSTVTFSDGSTIYAESIKGVDKMVISVPEAGEKPSKPSECMCNKYFAEGIVREVFPVAGFVDAAQMYTVDVCQYDDTVITVTDCVAMDWHVYAVNDRVWCCLTQREVIATRPYTYASSDNFKFSACYGCMGTERGYVTATETDAYWTSLPYGNYEGIRFFIAGFDSETDYYGNDDKGYGKVIPWQWELHKPIPNGWGQGSPRYYYENVTVTASLDPLSMYAAGIPLTVLDEDWPGKYPHMCALKPDIVTPYWMVADWLLMGHRNYSKDVKWLYGAYAMKEARQTGSGGDIPQPESKKYLFNLQIIQMS